MSARWQEILERIESSLRVSMTAQAASSDSGNGRNVCSREKSIHDFEVKKNSELFGQVSRDPQEAHVCSQAFNALPFPSLHTTMQSISSSPSAYQSISPF